MSRGLFQDVMDGYIKIFRLPLPNYQLSCRFLSGGLPVQILWVANFRFSLYETCVQNQWGNHLICPFVLCNFSSILNILFLIFSLLFLTEFFHPRKFRLKSNTKRKISRNLRGRKKECKEEKKK